MGAKLFTWAEIEPDNPIPLLTRRLVTGEQALVASVELEQGCVVAVHSHASEQIAVMLSGRARWTVGGEEFEMRGGQALLLPANVPHGVVALEPTKIFDVLAPPGPMGVDRQGG